MDISIVTTMPLATLYLIKDGHLTSQPATEIDRTWIHFQVVQLRYWRSPINVIKEFTLNGI